MLRYSDATFAAIRRAGCKMIFFGAESGSDWVLKEMNKQLRTEQTLELAARIRQFDIIPEFSFVVGNPKDPERDTTECLSFIRTIKKINPASEIIIYPTLRFHARGCTGTRRPDRISATPDEWTTERWQNLRYERIRRNPWAKPSTLRRLDDLGLS
jgi:tRNA A37 methylthiotransferase MiaB